MKTWTIEDQEVISKYLRTPEGIERFKAAVFHGWPTFSDAIREHYIPIMIAKARGKT